MVVSSAPVWNGTLIGYRVAKLLTLDLQPPLPDKAPHNMSAGFGTPRYDSSFKVAVLSDPVEGEKFV